MHASRTIRGFTPLPKSCPESGNDNRFVTGFTLIELLVVISIISLLTTVVLSSLNSARTKARDASRLSDIRTLQTALEWYYSENGTYPISSWISSYQSGWESGTLGTSLESQLPTMPVDPLNETGRSYSGYHSYSYYAQNYGRSGGWYMIVFTLENQNTSLDAKDGSTACNGQFFNYGGNDGYIITVGGSCVN